MFQNNLQLASGQVDGWRACILAGLASFKQFNTGRVQLVGRRLELKNINTRRSAL